MATPQPSTPGDARENHAQQVGALVGAVFAQVELVLIAMIADLARRVAARTLQPGVALRRLARTASTLFAVTSPRALAVAGVDKEAVAPLLESAASTAEAAALDALQVAVDAAEAAETPTGAAANVFSPYQQAVERAINSASLPATSLSLSRVQAAQKALDDLATQGLTGFVDRTGRRWNLASYVEMASRTAVSNAWDDRAAATLARVGVDLVLVGTLSSEGSCPHCLPWLGRTLSLAGEKEGYPTLAEAKAAGFRHPNCRCWWAPIGAPTAVPSPAQVERMAAVYKASQRQRALERRVRAAHRLAAAAVTPRARAEARRRLNAALAASEQHRSRMGFDAATVRRREHPHRAR